MTMHTDSSLKSRLVKTTNLNIKLYFSWCQSVGLKCEAVHPTDGTGPYVMHVEYVTVIRSVSINADDDDDDDNNDIEYRLWQQYVKTTDHVITACMLLAKE